MMSSLPDRFAVTGVLAIDRLVDTGFWRSGTNPSRGWARSVGCRSEDDPDQSDQSVIG
jgi:hypothetical protein